MANRHLFLHELTSYEVTHTVSSFYRTLTIYNKLQYDRMEQPPQKRVITQHLAWYLLKDLHKIVIEFIGNVLDLVVYSFDSPSEPTLLRQFPDVQLINKIDDVPGKRVIIDGRGNRVDKATQLVDEVCNRGWLSCCSLVYLCNVEMPNRKDIMRFRLFDVLMRVDDYNNNNYFRRRRYYKTVDKKSGFIKHTFDPSDSVPFMLQGTGGFDSMQINKTNDYLCDPADDEIDTSALLPFGLE